MDVTTVAGASAFQAANAKDKIQMAVAAKSLDAQRQQGDAVVKLIEQAAEVQQNSPSSEGLDVKA